MRGPASQAGLLLRAFRRLGRCFGRRDLILRSSGRVTYIPLPRSLQLAIVATLIAFGGWVGHTTVGYFNLQDIVAGMDVRILRGDLENRTLMDEMVRMRNQFSELAGTLELNHRKLGRILGENNALKNDLNKAQNKLNRVERTRRETLQRHASLGEQLSMLEKQLQDVENRNTQLTGTLKNTKTELTAVMDQRQKIETARRWLKNYIDKLQGRIASLKNSQKNLLDRMTEKTLSEIRRMESLIVATGLKTEKLLRRSAGGASGMGGPFIPLEVGKSAALSSKQVVEAFDHQMRRLEVLRRVVRGLPLISPVDYYYVSSKFGRRRDPFNKKWAQHVGVDLAGNLRAPVLSPAPGKVVFVGWKGGLGRIIVIDHGNGIRTRYGHLRRYHVKRGQRVGYRQKIGQLGNSGRSTGPHVHYEILLDGKPVDPMKFLEAGKNVLKG